MKELAKELKEEAKNKNLEIGEYTTQAYMDDMRWIELNNLILSDNNVGAATYALSEMGEPGITVFNGTMSDFIDDPYSIALHDLYHLYGIGRKGKSSTLVPEADTPTEF